MDWVAACELGFWSVATLASFYTSGKLLKRAEQSYLRTRSAKNTARYTNTVDDILSAVEPKFIANRGLPDQEETKTSTLGKLLPSSQDPGHSLPERILGGDYFSVNRSRDAPPIPRQLNTFRIKKLGMKILNSSIVFEVMVEGKLHTSSPYHVTAVHPTITTVEFVDSRFRNRSPPNRGQEPRQKQSWSISIMTV